MSDAIHSDLPLNLVTEDDQHIALGAQLEKGVLHIVVHDGNAQCFVIVMTPFEVESFMSALQTELNRLHNRTLIV